MRRCLRASGARRQRNAILATAIGGNSPVTGRFRIGRGLVDAAG